MGGYDPHLIKVGAACKESVRAVQIAYLHWTVLLRHPEFDFETLISDILKQIASHSPTGPILLAGYSFGGIVGFAVATRLREAGWTVCFLGLLDIEAQPGIATGARRRRMTRRRELAGFMAALQRGEGSSKLAYVISRRLISPRWKPALRLVAAIPRTWWSGNFASYLDRDLLFWHFEPLLRQWATVYPTLPPLDAPVFLFRTEQHDADVPLHLGWNQLCPNLTVLSVPGTHGDLLGPTLPAICAAFTRAVSQVMTKQKPSPLWRG